MGRMDNLKKALQPLGALAGITGAAALVNRRLRTTSALPIDRVGGVRRRWQWRGYEIFVTELGEGPPLLLVHGVSAGASSFEYRLLAPLLARERRVVAIDLLGCGLSDKPDLEYSAELYADLIADALGALCEGPAILVGSGLGGAFCVRVATRALHGLAGLVVIGPTGLGGVLDAEPSGAQRALALLMRSPIAGESAFNGLASKPSLGWFLRQRVYADPNAVTDDIVEHYYAVTHQDGSRFAPAQFLGGALNCNVARDLPFVETPVLVLWGERASETNPVRNAFEYLRLAPNAQLTTFPASGLLPQEEEPEAVAEAIFAFAREPKPANAAPEAAAAASDATPAAEQPAVQSGSLAIFKSYDVRGIYPSELNDDLAYKIGRVFVDQLQLKTVAVGRDMRPSGAALFEAFARGATESGAGVIDIGMVSTDALYFAVGKYEYAGGVMITASHNPANYNGMKFTGPRAEAISLETGLGAVRDRIAAGALGTPAVIKGTVTERDILEDFAEHCLRFVDAATIKPFKIAIDAGNGMAGRTVPYVFKRLPCSVIPLYFELDGTFPNHPASPIEPENMVDLQRAVLENGCDLGVAFDGDADRMFIVDEKGGLVGGDMVTALVGINTLKRHPGAKILYNLICSRSVPEAIAMAGGVPMRSQVGHSIIKKVMREEDITFGGEHSGHFYFKDNWFADSGMIALMQCLELFSDAHKPVSDVIAPINNRFRSGEINSRVHDIPAKMALLEAHYADAIIDHLDGATIQYPHWWMNVRPSNTEPLLRLNVEGDTRELMEQHRDEALALIRS
ncbi:MAG: alpha/beta fold hydrolase [Candidatus Eremiobacteraeota bacterium]|nr:alpha/beta fold hydrolase [Candidatus Eremiobacteraeota bacterium]